MRDPNAVISTDELAALLHRAQVRVYDCTTYNNPPPNRTSRSRRAEVFDD